MKDINEMIEKNKEFKNEVLNNLASLEKERLKLIDMAIDPTVPLEVKELIPAQYTKVLEGKELIMDILSTQKASLCY